MRNVINLACVRCGKEFSTDKIRYTCDQCGIAGILDVRFDYPAMQKTLTRRYLASCQDYSMWRYFPAIPVNGKTGIQPLKVGWTPLYRTDRFQQETGLEELFVKDDSRNPTASLKDRASAVAVARAVEYGARTICAASTGNAASSLAGFAACAGIETVIFVPQTAPEAKVTQLLIYGSKVFLIDGTYDQAVELCFEAASEFGWYNRSCAINPYLVEGKKTIAYELCEQMNWTVPDLVVVAVGDGCTISAVWKGFKECYALSLIDRLPKIIGVQAENADPVTRAFNQGTSEFEYRKPQTIADSIAVGVPRNGIKALNAVRESAGFMIDVTDDEILAAMLLLARRTGLFGEPAGVAGFAGIMKMHQLDMLAGHETVVSIISGSGLKDIRSAGRACGKTITIAPDLAELKKTI